MARGRASLVYIGIKYHVIAFNRKTGEEVWRTPLPAKHRSSGSLVNVVRDADGLFASCAGELFSLDPRSGQVLWHDGLKGLGTGLLTIATDLAGATQASVVVAAELAQQQATTAATSAAM